MNVFLFAGVANDDSKEWCRAFDTLAEAEACRERADEYCERRGTSLVYDSIREVSREDADRAVARHAASLATA